MKHKARSTVRVLISSAIAALGFAFTAKFAVVAPVVTIAERAAVAKVCQVVWAGYSRQEVEYNDPVCFSHVAEGPADHDR